MAQPEAPGTQPNDKLLGTRSLKIRIVLASAVLLAVGALLAPGAAPGDASQRLSAPEGRAAPLLEEQVQRREAGLRFRGVQDVATRVRDHGAAIQPAAELRVQTLTDFAREDGPRAAQAGFGVYVSDTQMLTHADALGGRATVTVSTPGAEMVEARVAAYEASTGLVLLQTPPTRRPPVTLASEIPAAGTLAVAVGQRDGRDVAVPVFITDVSNGRYEIADMGGSVRPGMPVYNLDGELLAVAAGDGPPAQAYPAGDSTRRLLAISSADQGRASLGLALQPLTGALAGAFGEQGALIADVVTGGPGDQAGIEPGDVLRGVGDSEIANIDEATRALRLTAPGTVVALRVVRSGRLRTLEATAASVFEVATLARVVGQETPAGLDARALFPAASLRDANVPSAAVVLGVNGRAVASLAQVRRDLRGARRPVTLLLRHDGRRFFAVLEPQR